MKRDPVSMIDLTRRAQGRRRNQINVVRWWVYGITAAYLLALVVGLYLMLR